MSIPTRKNLIAPIILIPLALAFFTVCLLLIIKKNDARLIRRKLRIGALILTFSAFSSNVPHAAASCYEAEMPTISPVDYKVEAPEISGTDGVKIRNAWNLVLLEGAAQRVIFYVEESFTYFTDLGFKLVTRDDSSGEETIVEGLLMPVDIDSSKGGSYVQFEVPDGLTAPAEYLLLLTGIPDTENAEREVFEEVRLELADEARWAEL